MEAVASVEETIGEENIPNADELENFYGMLENGNIPQLSWKCPGRRAPSSERTHKVEQNVKTESIETLEPVKTDFDFSDDISQPQMRVRGQNTTPKSAKKKTANFAGVMEQLKKKNAEG